MKTETKNPSIKALVVIVLSILSLFPVEVNAASAGMYAIRENLTSLPNLNRSAFIYPASEDNILLSYSGSTDSAVYFKVDPKQTSGSKGTVVITPWSTASMSAISTKDIKCWLDRASDTGGTDGILSTDIPAFVPAETQTEIQPLSYDSSSKRFAGDFTVNEPGLYKVLVTDGQQTRLLGSSTVRFRLEGSALPHIPIDNGKELRLDWSSVIPGWDRLDLTDLTAQSVKVLTPSGKAEVALGNAVNSLLVQKGRAGEEIDIEIQVTYNHHVDNIRLRLQISEHPLPLWLISVILPSLLIIVIIAVCLLYMRNVHMHKKIAGSLTIHCECESASLSLTSIKFSYGRTISLYKLLNGALKKCKDHEADVIRRIADNRDNKESLRKIHIDMVKGSDKRFYYAFQEAGNSVIIDEVPRQVYQNSGSSNTKLTVKLSFIDNRTQKMTSG